MTNMETWVTGAGGQGLNLSTPTSDVFTGANRISGDSYDAAGNQLVVGPYTLTYDVENRQSSEQNGQGVNATYGYDGLGQRVEKMLSSGDTTVYVYDAFGRKVAEYSSQAAVEPACQTCYLTYDHLGSLRVVTDENAQVVSRHDYLPFGEEVLGGTLGRSETWGPWADDMSQRFTGQDRNQETQLDFFNARYFSGALGRFTSPIR